MRYAWVREVLADVQEKVPALLFLANPSDAVLQSADSGNHWLVSGDGGRLSGVFAWATPMMDLIDESTARWRSMVALSWVTVGSPALLRRCYCRCWQRHYFPAANSDPVSVHYSLGRFGLSRAGGVLAGPGHAIGRPVRAVDHSDDLQFRVCGTRALWRPV